MDTFDIVLNPVTSSNLEAVGYCPDRRCLKVRFTSGATYRYLDVPPEVVEAFLAAPSLGKAFAADIRGAYAFEKE